MAKTAGKSAVPSKPKGKDRPKMNGGAKAKAAASDKPASGKTAKPVARSVTAAKSKSPPAPLKTGKAKSAPIAAIAKAPKAIAKPAARRPAPTPPARDSGAQKSKAAAKPAAAQQTKMRQSKVASPVITAPRKVLPKSQAVTGNGRLAPSLSQPIIPNAVSPRGKTMPNTPIDIASIRLPDAYRPSDDEPFMGPHQRAYFRQKLMKWKDDIIKETMETLQVLHDDTAQHPDLADRATSETDRALELRARDRQRKLIAKIDAALRRIEDGSYGYCEETGEPIALKRLDARPVATLSLEAQERHERRERVYRDE